MKKLLLAALISGCLATTAQAAVIYGVDENNNLVTFDSAAPGTTLSSVAITGVTDSIGALDFRPRNGALYAFGSDKIVYTINTMTGVATAQGAALAITGTQFAFDFNPTIDRLRIVSNTDDNYVFNPDTMTGAAFVPVFYPGADANAGANPEVTAAAYTTSVFGAPGSSTQLYSIDTALNILTKQANSAGTLTTVGALGFDLGSRSSFDILGSDAFAFNGTSLYNVNLNTGALTLLGNTDRALFGIAISAPVPEPASWAMMILGLGVVGFAIRRSGAAGRRAFA